MGFIQIPYDGEKNVTVHKIGDKILYYTDSRNFVLVKNQPLASIETQVKCTGIKTYKKIDNEYVPTNEYNNAIDYYTEEGTLEVDCPACGNLSGKPGYLKGDDDKYYICPRCGGTGKLIVATDFAPIISTTVSQNSPEEDGYEVIYRIVPDESLSINSANMTSIVIESDQFLEHASLVDILEFWENLAQNLDEYYRNEDLNDNFYNNYSDKYREKINELKLFMYNETIDNIKG